MTGRPRRPRDAWRDQAGHDDTRTDASGPDMWDPAQDADDGIRNPAEANWNESR